MKMLEKICRKIGRMINNEITFFKYTPTLNHVPCESHPSKKGETYEKNN